MFVAGLNQFCLILARQSSGFPGLHDLGDSIEVADVELHVDTVVTLLDQGDAIQPG